MKNREITQDNLYLILPGKVSRMAVMYSKEFNIPLLDALGQIYRSRTYMELEDESSKLWHLGPVALYEMFMEERNNHILNQFA